MVLGAGWTSECSLRGGQGQPGHGSWPYWVKECKRPEFAACTDSLSWPCCRLAWSWGTGKQPAQHHAEAGTATATWGTNDPWLGMALCWATSCPHIPAPDCIDFSQVPKADALPGTIRIHVLQGRGAKQDWGRAPVLPPHGTALTR